MNFEEFKELLNSDEFVPYDKEYKDIITFQSFFPVPS